MHLYYVIKVFWLVTWWRRGHWCSWWGWGWRWRRCSSRRRGSSCFQNFIKLNVTSPTPFSAVSIASHFLCSNSFCEKTQTVLASSVLDLAADWLFCFGLIHLLTSFLQLLVHFYLHLHHFCLPYFKLFLLPAQPAPQLIPSRSHDVVAWNNTHTNYLSCLLHSSYQCSGLILS